ncbi:hypothetical protein ACF0H5_014000 [Mactra antiquata]
MSNLVNLSVKNPISGFVSPYLLERPGFAVAQPNEFEKLYRPNVIQHLPPLSARESLELSLDNFNTDRLIIYYKPDVPMGHCKSRLTIVLDMFMPTGDKSSLLR